MFYRRVSKDDIRAMLGAEYSRPNEDTVCNIRDAIIKVLVNDQCSVIVDDTNASDRHVNRLKLLCQKLGVDYRIVEIETPVEECIERDVARPNPVGETVIRKLDVQLNGYRLTPAEMDYLRKVL